MKTSKDFVEDITNATIASRIADDDTIGRGQAARAAAELANEFATLDVADHMVKHIVEMFVDAMDRENE